jgi:hypothetical protein
MGEDFYANLYTLLIGPPATGKSVAMTASREVVWAELKEYFVAPKSMTAASMSDALEEAKMKIVRLGPGLWPPFVEFNSLVINSPELGVLLAQYDRDIVQRLTDVYDAGSWEERRRGTKMNMVIAKAQINLLAACTPSFLNEMLPPGAWDQGFMSRVIMIFSGEPTLKNLFEVPPQQDQLKSSLIEDIKTISNLYGEMTWTNSSRAAIQDWENAGGPPQPDHHKLVNYSGRRTANMLKLMMVASVSRSNEMIVREEDFHSALAWLLEAESFMPDIFKSMRGSTTDAVAMEEAWYYLWQTAVKDNKPITESRVLQLLARYLPSFSIHRALDMMIRLNMITVIGADSGGNLYKPLARGKHDKI